MGKSNKKTIILKMNLPDACSTELRGRQSVRATFKLSSASIDAISVVARHLGIKQKSLFDHLVEDIQSLTSVAKEAGKLKKSRGHRVQKTFVISRRSLCSLDQVSKSFNTPRDALVEISVQRLLPLIANERGQQEKRRKMLVEVQKHFQKDVLLLEKWRKALGDEDPLVDRLAAVVHDRENALRQMNDIIEQGRVIEMFESGLL
jgi:hypothetical protein